MSSQLKDLLSDTTEIGIFMIWLLNLKEWNGWVLWVQMIQILKWLTIENWASILVWFFVKMSILMSISETDFDLIIIPDGTKYCTDDQDSRWRGRAFQSRENLLHTQRPLVLASYEGIHQKPSCWLYYFYNTENHPENKVYLLCSYNYMIHFDQ